MYIHCLSDDTEHGLFECSYHKSSFSFFRMPLNPICQTFIPRPYIFKPLLSFYRTSFNRLCSVRSESHIKHLFVAWKQKETNTFTVLRRGQSKTRNFIQDPAWLRRILNKREGK